MLFIPKDKIEGDSFTGNPLTLKQVRNANPNVSIPVLKTNNMKQLKEVTEGLGYEICESIQFSDFKELIGDSFKEKILVAVGCKKESGKWKRELKPDKLHGDDLRQMRFRLRAKRNELLLKSDWTQAEDSPLSDEQKAEWKTYRQKLRDITKNYDHPVWCGYPTPPKGE